jgi:hypothetical protein
MSGMLRSGLSAAVKGHRRQNDAGQLAGFRRPNCIQYPTVVGLLLPTDYSELNVWNET